MLHTGCEEKTHTPHQRLLWKIQNIGGLQGNTLNWITDFLRDREMRTVIKGEKSEWCRVTSGVPKGTVLAPLMFLVYVNDMVDEVDSYISLFSDNARLLKRVENNMDCEILQKDLNKIYKWSKEMGNRIQCKEMQGDGIRKKKKKNDKFLHHGRSEH